MPLPPSSAKRPAVMLFDEPNKRSQPSPAVSTLRTKDAADPFLLFPSTSTPSSTKYRRPHSFDLTQRVLQMGREAPITHCLSTLLTLLSTPCRAHSIKNGRFQLSFTPRVHQGSTAGYCGCSSCTRCSIHICKTPICALFDEPNKHVQPSPPTTSFHTHTHNKLLSAQQ